MNASRKRLLYDLSLIPAPREGEATAANCDGTTKVCPTDLIADANVLCRGSVGVCDADEYCDGINVTCPGEDYTSVNGDTCDDGNELTENDECLDGDCAGDLMAGVCGNALAIDALPYTTTGTTAGRPSGLDTYGVGCAAASQPEADIVYELTVEAGVEYQILLTPTDGGDLALDLLGACGEDEACIASANAGGAGEAEVIVGTAGASGTVYIVVEGSGAYELAVSTVEQPDDDALPDADGIEPSDDAELPDDDTVEQPDEVTDEEQPDEIGDEPIDEDGPVLPEEDAPFVTDDAPIVTDDAPVVTDDAPKPDADTPKPDTTADEDTEQPDETTDEAADEAADELLGDEDLITTPDDYTKPKNSGCGCSIVF